MHTFRLILLHKKLSYFDSVYVDELREFVDEVFNTH